MDATRKLFRLGAVVALTVMLWVSVPAVRAVGPITVETTSNVLGDGLCSFEEAVAAANNNTTQDSGACPAGSNSVQDIIEFDISGSPPYVITLASMLTISQAVTLDGASEPDWSGTPVVVITNNLAYILTIQSSAPYTTINELQFTSTYPGAGNTAHTVRVEADGVVLTGNYFNTDGVNRLGMGAGGVLIYGSNALVGTGEAAARNLFGGRIGVYVIDGTLNFITGNYFGVQAGGSTALAGTASTYPAIQFAGGDATNSNHLVHGNVIAGYSSGVLVQHPSHHNTISGNYIGVGADGLTSLGNLTGVYIMGSSSNTIGGTSAGDRNVISASTGDANVVVTTFGSSPDSNVIQGNYIGTTANGLSALSPPANGIKLEAGVGTQIGGSEPGSGNLISGNVDGILGLSAAANTLIRGNWIGLDATGMDTLGNTTGIFLAGGSANIGDETTPGLNVISGNGLTGWSGLDLRFSASATIYGNRFGLSANGAAALPNRVSIYLEGASAVVSENWIANSVDYGVQSDDGSEVLGGSTDNCFTGNTFAVINPSDPDAAWAENWWGSATGPTHLSNPGGTGDAVGENVLYSPFMTSRPWVCRGVPSDYDGDYQADVAVFNKAAGNWFVLGSTDGFFAPALNFGGNAADYLAVPGDYDGDGSTDAAVFQKATGNWFVIGTTDGFFTPALGFGNFTDFWPVPADYDGDGKTDPAVVHRTNGNWFVVGSTDGFFSPALNFGDASFIPVPADYDGDGQTDAAMYEKATGNWFVVGSTDGFFTPALSFGGTGYMPVPEDYDGDGTADPAVFHEAAGNWFVVGSTEGFFAPALGFGGTTATFTPLPADYDGDGKTDPAAFDRTAGNWFVVGSTDGFFMPALNFGGNASVYRPVIGSWWLTELATD